MTTTDNKKYMNETSELGYLMVEKAIEESKNSMLEKAIEESKKVNAWFGYYSLESSFEQGGVRVSGGKVNNVSLADLDLVESSLKKSYFELSPYLSIKKGGMHVMNGELVFDTEAYLNHLEFLGKLGSWLGNKI